MKRSKRYKKALELIEKKKVYDLAEGVEILKTMSAVKFDETVEISCKLNADPRKSDQMIRGSIVLPNGTGKNVKVLVFCEAEKEDAAKDAGADYVGSQDLIDKISKDNWFNFDCCISTPSMMRVVSKLGKLLGPRGLMPSPKTGTVTENIAAAVKESKAGKVDFRMDKLGCMSVGVGKVSFSSPALTENIKVFWDAFLAAKPAAVKGDFVRGVFISTTMGPSVKVKI